MHAWRLVVTFRLDIFKVDKIAAEPPRAPLLRTAFRFPSLDAFPPLRSTSDRIFDNSFTSLISQPNILPSSRLNLPVRQARCDNPPPTI
jgi:hypothetical protein